MSPSSMVIGLRKTIRIDSRTTWDVNLNRPLPPCGSGPRSKGRLLMEIAVASIPSSDQGLQANLAMMGDRQGTPPPKFPIGVPKGAGGSERSTSKTGVPLLFLLLLFREAQYPQLEQRRRGSRRPPRGAISFRATPGYAKHLNAFLRPFLRLCETGFRLTA